MRLMPFTRVVFLDFDGVMNNRKFLTDGVFHSQDDKVDPRNVAVLNGLLANCPGTGVVISSIWRFGRRRLQIQDLLRDKGFEGYVVDMTPILGTMDGPRNEEIQAWLDGNRLFEVRSFVILDDHLLGGGPLEDHLVMVDSEFGLTQQDAEKARQILDSV